MSSKEIVLSDQEQLFINLVIEYEGNLAKAARDSGYSSTYGYALRNRLSKEIAKAAQQYIALHSAKAAKRLVDTMDEDLPNPTKLSVINAILDRAGVKPEVEKEEEKPIVKANIFILPEKRVLEIVGEITDV